MRNGTPATNQLVRLCCGWGGDEVGRCVVSARVRELVDGGDMTRHFKLLESRIFGLYDRNEW